MDTEEEVILAVLPVGDSRQRNWMELFKAVRVPIVRSDPLMTLLPDGTSMYCYFVDFRKGGEALLKHLIQWNHEHPTKNQAAVARMLESRLYPIKADGVTVVRARLGLWVS